jgi:hypothetical protein
MKQLTQWERDQRAEKRKREKEEKAKKQAEREKMELIDRVRILEEELETLKKHVYSHRHNPLIGSR